MAHEIYIAANGQASMAYVGKTPWHGLGQELQAGLSIEQWCVAAGLDYTVERAIVQYQNGELRTFPGKDVLYRSDTSAPLGIVSDGYKIVQPAEVLDFFRDLCADRGFTLETAGALKGGAIYWALARTEHESTLGANDTSRGYVLLSTSADGTRATDARFTAVRVVCNNTLSIALNGSVGATKTRHSTMFNARATKKSLGLIDFDKAWSDFSDSMRAMAQYPIADAEASAMFANLLRPAGMRPAPRLSIGATSFDQLLNANVGAAVEFAPIAKDRAIRGLGDLEHSYHYAPGAMPGTAYGVLQGVTHYIDHVRGTSNDKRLNSAWFGQGETIKREALERLTDLIHQ